MRRNSFPFPGLEKLFAVYSDLEDQMAGFKRLARIDCLSKCQKCCETAKFVEASPLEMLPLSIHLWAKRKAEPLLEQLMKVDPEGPCILLNRDPSLPSKGGCRYYSLRPLTCRLFGFSAIVNKYGNPRIVLCKPLKEPNPGIEDLLNERIQEGLKVPVIPHFSRQVAFIDPNFGQRSYSINYSLRQALEIVGYRMQFQKESET
jgi:Fe-S-cluster containining protein